MIFACLDKCADAHGLVETLTVIFNSYIFVRLTHTYLLEELKMSQNRMAV